MLKQDEIFDILKNRIIKLEYKPGMILNEVDLAEEFEVSRTPIRHAFQRLENKKLIQIVPRYGAQISQIDFIKMKALFEVTMQLDPFSTRLAIDNASEEDINELSEIVTRLKAYDMKIPEEYGAAIADDEAFHQKVLDLCGNDWLKEILSDLHCHTERLWHYCNSFFESSEIFYKTLEPIVEAFREKDVEKAIKYHKIHIEGFLNIIKNTLL